MHVKTWYNKERNKYEPQLLRYSYLWYYCSWELLIKPLRYIQMGQLQKKLETRKGSSQILQLQQSPTGRKKTLPLFWQGLGQWKGMGALSTAALPPSFALYRSILLSVPWVDLHVAHHGHRLWIAALFWSQINASLLEKYLAVHLFQVNNEQLDV